MTRQTQTSAYSRSSRWFEGSGSSHSESRPITYDALEENSNYPSILQIDWTSASAWPIRFINQDLAGPSLVKAAIGQMVDAEELGGAKMHAEISGTVDFYEKDDPSCLKRLRSLIALLPEANEAKHREKNASAAS